MIEKASRRRPHDVKPMRERVWSHYLANAGTWDPPTLYANAPKELDRDWMHQMFRSWRTSGRIIKTRDGRYRMMGCV